MSEFPTQRIDPKYKYCAINFKNIADYGSASTHGGNYCTDCLHCANARACAHPALAKPFSLGTHPERMGCRNALEEGVRNMRKRRIYIAGPMTGIARWNRPAFVKAAERLRGLGWEVTSPIEISDAFGSQNTIVTTPGLLDTVIDEELAQLATCDAIYLLTGWENSRGAKTELLLALEKGMDVITERSGVVYKTPKAALEVALMDPIMVNPKMNVKVEK